MTARAGRVARRSRNTGRSPHNPRHVPPVLQGWILDQQAWQLDDITPPAPARPRPFFHSMRLR